MLTVRLNPDQEKQLDRVSKTAHQSKSEVVKAALDLYFKTLQTEAPNAYEAGKTLFGRHRSGQTDRSAHYKQQLKEKLRAKNAH